MILQIDPKSLSSLSSFALPRYSEIPDVGLYLNQCATYINRVFQPLGGISITESMISNYVKKKLVPNPVKKQYSRESIAILLFIAAAKTVVSLDDIQTLLVLVRKNFQSEESYEFFRREFSIVLGEVFGFECEERDENESGRLEKELLGNILVTVCNKIYIDLAFSFLRKSGI